MCGDKYQFYCPADLFVPITSCVIYSCILIWYSTLSYLQFSTWNDKTLGLQFWTYFFLTKTSHLAVDVDVYFLYVWLWNSKLGNNHYSFKIDSQRVSYAPDMKNRNWLLKSCGKRLKTRDVQENSFSRKLRDTHLVFFFLTEQAVFKLATWAIPKWSSLFSDQFC